MIAGNTVRYLLHPCWCSGRWGLIVGADETQATVAVYDGIPPAMPDLAATVARIAADPADVVLMQDFEQRHAYSGCWTDLADLVAHRKDRSCQTIDLAYQYGMAHEPHRAAEHEKNRDQSLAGLDLWNGYSTLAEQLQTDALARLFGLVAA